MLKPSACQARIFRLVNILSVLRMIGRVHMNERLSDVTRMLLDVSVSQKKLKIKKKCYNKQKKVTTNIKFYILIVFMQT
jgi:hypothetical protein